MSILRSTEFPFDLPYVDRPILGTIIDDKDGNELLKITYEYNIFWKGRLLKEVIDFKLAFCEIHTLLESKGIKIL